MYDMQGIYNHVLRRGTLVDGTEVVLAPENYSLSCRPTMEQIALFDSWSPNGKRAKSEVWEFTITENGVGLQVYKKTIDSNLVLAIAESYRRLMGLIDPYEKAVSA